MIPDNRKGGSFEEGQEVGEQEHMESIESRWYDEERGTSIAMRPAVAATNRKCRRQLFLLAVLLLFTTLVGVLVWRLGSSEGGSGSVSAVQGAPGNAAAAAGSPTPSVVPSSQPTSSSMPSARDLVSASFVSSVFPTILPSTEPSESPSIEQSDGPSTTPTVQQQPSLSPSVAPSSSPSKTQSESPSQLPSLDPSIAPSTALAQMLGNSTSLVLNNSNDQPVVQACNGLAANCNRRVNQIMYAAVHNAMSSQEDGFIAANNLLSLEKALEAGFRALQLDSCDCAQQQEDELFEDIELCHGVCFAGTRDPIQVFQSIVTFLTGNPNEVLIVDVQADDDSLQGLFALISTIPGFLPLLYTHPKDGSDWPLLSELISLDQRLILFQHNANCNAPDSCPNQIHNTFDFMFDTPFDISSPEDLLDASKSCRVNRGSSSSDFFLLNYFAAGFLGLPSLPTAAIVNSASNIESVLDSCQTKLGRNVNFLLVDFWSIGDVLEVVQAHNEGLAWRN